MLPNTKWAFWFSVRICLKHFSFLAESSKIWSKMCTVVHVKCRLFLLDLSESWIFIDRFSKNTQMPKFTKVLLVRAELCHEDRRSVAFSFFCILRKRIRKVKFFSVSFSRYSSKQSGVLGDREPGFRSQVGARYLVQYLRILTVRLMKNQVCGGMDGWMDGWIFCIGFHKHRPGTWELMTEYRYGPLKWVVTVTGTVLTDNTIVPNYVTSSVLNVLKILQGSFADTRREPDGHDFEEIYSSKALSQNCEKWLLPSSCLSVSPFGPHGPARLPLDGFTWNLIFEHFSNNCWENSSFIKIG